MGRSRKPTAVLDATGAFAKNPQRKAARENEPEPNGPIGDAPDYFNQTELSIWDEYVDEAPAGVLTKGDRKTLELAVRLTAKARFERAATGKWIRCLARAMESVGASEDDIDEMKETFESMVGTTAAESGLLLNCLRSMGLTPADRSKVNVGKPEKKQDDPLARVLSQLGGPTAKVQ